MDEIFKYLICCLICLFIGRWAIAEISIFIPEFQQGIDYIDDLAHQFTHDKWLPEVTEAVEASKDLSIDETAETANLLLKKAKKTARSAAEEVGISVPDSLKEPVQRQAQKDLQLIEDGLEDF
ncbi:MAG: hypothetical protein R3A13_02310 [Bdellovibrionota bacterium]